MSRMAIATFGAALLVFASATSSVAQRGHGGGGGGGSMHSGGGGRGGGGWHGGGGGSGWHGGGHGGGWRGGHNGGSVFFGVGPGWWDPYPYWYPGGYYGGYGYGYAPPYYAPPVDVEPHEYVDQGAAPPGDDDRGAYWYYCPSSKGYYPRVRECREEWLKVVPRSADDD